RRLGPGAHASSRPARFGPGKRAPARSPRRSGIAARPCTAPLCPARPGTLYCCPPRVERRPELERMSRIIAIANQKGGVGKTTTAINLGACLAVAERRTLVIDIDPQANATSGLGIARERVQRSIYEVLVEGAPAREAVLPEVHFPYLDVLPATRDLVGVEVELVDRGGRETLLRDALDRKSTRLN